MFEFWISPAFRWGPGSNLANTRGANKILWCSDYPILPMQRCSKEGWAVPIKDEVKRRYLRENAIEVFKLNVTK